MKILIDTNVIIDYVSEREPFTSAAKKIFALCLENKVEGFIAAHSIPDAYYILRKTFSDKERRAALLLVCRLTEVVGVDGGRLAAALNKENFRDFEDCLQDECAVACKADYIITRNVKDFSESKVKAISPEDFIKLAA